MAASSRDGPRRAGRSAFRHTGAGRILFPVVLLSLLLSAPPSRAGSLSVSGGTRTLVLSAVEARAGITLPDVFVVTGSDSVHVDGTPLRRGIDYEVDRDQGTVKVSVPIPDAAEVVLTYRYLPLDIAAVYRTAVLESMSVLPPGFAAESRLVSGAAGEVRPAPPAHGLRVGGAKTFGITMGSDRDASLEQSLRLNISGDVTRDVSVRAYLSDQNTPLVPEGDTEELRALDKVLIEIEGENVSATLGDYELRIDGGPLAAFRREETGAMVTASAGPADVVLAGARSAGQFVSFSFRGTDGKQGPYLLADGSGATGVGVVAGSERVWLDGRELVRGRDRDYVIDYAAGEIEFTERVHVVGENEITVDYEHTSGDYERDSYAGRATLASPDGGPALGVSFFREADDRDASTSAALTAAELALLAGAGDDEELAHDDGIDSVGLGLGDYTYDPDDGAFDYAGAGLGEYDLNFERVDGGDYNFDYELGHYVYAGAGAGSFALGRSLAMPTDHGLVSADGHLPLPAGGYLDVSGALSSLDRNTHSELDDDDNLGNAQVLSARLPEVAFAAFGGSAATFSLGGRRVGGSFEGVGRFRETTYRERWELEGLDLPAGEMMLEGSSELSLGSVSDMRLSHAYLERGDALDSSRTEFNLEVRPVEGSRLWADGRFVDLTRSLADSSSWRERVRYRGGGQQVVGAVRPGLSYAHDERVSDGGGERYDEYRGSLESVGAGPFTFGAAYSHRLTDRTSGSGWNRASVTMTEEYRLGLNGWDALRVSGNVVRRRVEFETGFEDPATRYDLASLKLNHSSMDGGVSGEVHYSVTSTEIEELKRYVDDEGGVEVTRIVGTGKYIPVTDLTVSTKWKLAPGRRSRGAGSMPEPTRLRRLLSTLTLTSDIKLRETTETDDKVSLYLLAPDVIQSDDTVSGEISGRHVLRYLAPSNALSVRLVANTRDALDRQYTNDITRRLERSGTADIKLSRPGGVTYRIQGDAGRRERLSTGWGDSYRVDERSLLGEATLRQLGAFEGRIAASAAWQDERIEDIDVTVIKITPSVTYRIAGRGALTASVTRTEVESSAGSLGSRPYLAQGLSAGASSSWRLGGDYRFNRYLTGSLSYVGEVDDDSDVRHTMDLRVNAFF